MEPRILFIDHAGSLGGAELYLRDVVQPYRASSTVAVFEPGPFPDRLREDRIATIVLRGDLDSLQAVQKGSRLVDAVRAFPGLARRIQQLLPHARHHDVLFANSQKALIVGALTGVLARRPVIWNLHDMLTADHFSRLNRRVAVTCANLCVKRVIVNSEATRAAFAESGGHVQKTQLVYNGISPRPFEAVSPEDVERVRAPLDLPDAPLVGVFSRLAPWKGQHVAIRSLANVPGVHLLLVGDALFRGDTAYVRQLEQLVDHLDLSDRVHFLGFRDDVPTLMHLVDIVAHTSTAPEPFGRVVVEGMLAGRPVVATRAGGPREIIAHNRTGKLVPPEDPDQLTRALHSLLRNRTAAATMAERGRRDARERFSVAAMHAGIRTAIHDVLDPTRHDR
jgi:glycosyltransferase involved in cell wall biosynthesis